MELFEFTPVGSAREAVAAGAKANTAQQGANVRFIAGGTSLFDLMKLDVERPKNLIDVNHLPFDKIERTPDGGLKIGAMVRNATLANHPEVKASYPVLSQALLSGASAQLRNRATTAGNLLQKTRCVYFRDADSPCNKRVPGSGCSAIEGYNRNLAILGTSEACIASNPSDMNVALMALDATVHIQGVKGERTIPIGAFFLLPGDTPHLETLLQPGDLITHVSLPPLPAGTTSLYLKLRDRASYEFALASAAVAVQVVDGRFADVRLAMGGVGAIPWRAKEAEALLKGQPVDKAAFKPAAEAELKNAKPQSENGFKVELARRCLVHALNQATSPAPRSSQ